MREFTTVDKLQQKEVQKHDRSSNSNLYKGLNSKYTTADKLQQKEVRNQDTPQGRSTNSNLCIGTNSKYKTGDKPLQKEVRNQDRSTNSYLYILLHIYSGIQPATICKLEGIPKTTLQYYLNKLKHAGAICKIAYGTWEVSDTAFFDLKRSTKTSQVASNKVPQNLNFLTQDSVRGHGFVFTLKLDKGLRNWGRREEFLEKNNIKYIKLKIPKGGQRIIFKGRKIWLTNKSVIVYEKSSYFSETAKGAKDYAIYKFISLIKSLERYLHADFTIKAGRQYKFKVSRQHYALVKNALAQQYDKEGKKLQVYAANGLWFLIDNSFNLHEAETVHPETADDDNNKVQSFFNSLKDYPLTTDFILETMNGIQDNQLLFAQNHKTHVKAIEELGHGVRTLTDLLKLLDIRLKN